MPLIVYFHGGGFVLGDAVAYELQSAFMAARTGCVVLFVEFRRAPEHRFPAALEDAIDSAKWAIENAAQFDADPCRIAVAGDSAGGNLAANVCVALRDAATPRIRLQCLFYAVSDFRPWAGGNSYPSVEEFSSDFGLDREIMTWFLNKYLADTALVNDPRVSPILAPNLRGLPETYVVTAANDPLRDMGKAFADRLSDSGVDVTYRCFEGLIHNFLGHAAVSETAEYALLEVCDFIASRLHSSQA